MSVLGKRARRALRMRVIIILTVRLGIVSVAVRVVAPFQELARPVKQLTDDVVSGLSEYPRALGEISAGGVEATKRRVREAGQQFAGIECMLLGRTIHGR